MIKSTERCIAFEGKVRYMFCSKCGKQISDEAAFCEGCGNPTASVTNTATQAVPQVVYVQQTPMQVVASRTPAIPKEEKEYKTLAIGMFVLQSVLTLGFLIALVASEGRMIFSMFGNIPEWAMDDIWEEIGSIFVILLFGYLGLQVFIGILSYYLPYVHRNFSEHKKQVIGSCIADTLSLGIMPIVLGVVTAEEMNGELPVLLIFIALILAALCIFTAVLYKKAADSETYEKYRESKGAVGSAGEAAGYDTNKTLSRLTNIANGGNGSVAMTWTCPSCKTINKNTDSFCNGCGKYK